MLHSTWRCGGRGRGKRTSRSSTAASTTPARSAASTPAIGAAAVVVASWRPSRRLPSAAATDTDADADAGALTARYKARQGDGADINNGRPSVVRFRSNLSEALVIMTHFRLRLRGILGKVSCFCLARLPTASPTGDRLVRCMMNAAV